MLTRRGLFRRAAALAVVAPAIATAARGPVECPPGVDGNGGDARVCSGTGGDVTITGGSGGSVDGGGFFELANIGDRTIVMHPIVMET